MAGKKSLKFLNLSLSDSEETGRDRFPHPPAQHPGAAGAQHPRVPQQLQQGNPQGLQAAAPRRHLAQRARELLGPEEEAAVPDAQAGKVLRIQGGCN